MVYKLWVSPISQLPDRFKWDNDKARNWINAYIDNTGFDWQIFFVAATGFLTDSYALFATNVILPSLAYIYWPDSTNGRNQLAINCATLAGSVCGQALFGYWADRYGRRKLYGIELVIVIFGTLGMSQVSTGTNKSMSIILWIVFWRFFMGLGIGAEYPLSAVITAEFASTEYRSTMMACVFLMQPVGQFCAATVGWAVLTSLVKSRGLDNLPIHGSDLNAQQKVDIISTIDSVWRCVVAVGTIPAVFAILWRLSIPESPRYTLDVLNDGLGAFVNIREHHNEKTTEKYATDEIGRKQVAQPSTADSPPPDLPPSDGPPLDGPFAAPPDGTAMGGPSALPTSIGDSSGVPPSSDPSNPDESAGATDEAKEAQSRTKVPNYFTCTHLHKYFIEEKNWMWLAATSGCWALLDFAFYGLAIDNPRRIAAIWAPSYPNSTYFQNETQNWPSSFKVGNKTTVYSNASIPDWENPFDVGTNIYQELYGNAFRYVVTITVGSLVGSLVMIATIHKIRRKEWLIISFLILALLFVIMGAAMRVWMFTTSHSWAVAFYILCQFFFNFGPNTLTFIIPAEIFPTRYRCFCHGVSAAAGKLGSLAVQGLLSRREFTTDPTHFRIVLGCFSIPMVLGAVLAWAWLPSLQEPPIPSERTCIPPTIPSKTLETLAEGRKLATSTEAVYPKNHRLQGQLIEGQVLSFEGKFNRIRRRFQRSKGFDGRATVEEEGVRVGENLEMGKYPNTGVEDFDKSTETRSAGNGGARSDSSRH